jgi:hypothetical protein
MVRIFLCLLHVLTISSWVHCPYHIDLRVQIIKNLIKHFCSPLWSKQIYEIVDKPPLKKGRSRSGPNVPQKHSLCRPFRKITRNHDRCSRRREIQLTARNFPLCGETGCAVEWHCFWLPATWRQPRRRGLLVFRIRRGFVYYCASSTKVRPRVLLNVPITSPISTREHTAPRPSKSGARSWRRFSHRTSNAIQSQDHWVCNTTIRLAPSTPTESSLIPCLIHAIFPPPELSRSSQRRTDL